MREVNRRKFLHMSTLAGLGVGIGTSCASTPGDRATDMPFQVAQADIPAVQAKVAPGRVTANDKISLGFIGVAGRGMYLLDRFLSHDDVEVVAVCDTYQKHMDAAVERTGGTARAYSDFRELLDQPDIDAVVCATPPHWHPLISIMACEAGKDIYCEKPMSFSPIEGLAMIKAARLNHRVTQIGTQIHATDNYHHVVDIVRSGVLGKISRVHCVLNMNDAPHGLGNQPNTPPPEGLNWDMWCGPAPMLPFNEAFFVDGRHRYVRELIGSWIHEMGPHIVDLPVWALNLGEPKSAVAMGGKFATDDISTIPDTFEVIWDYGDMLMTWTNQCANSHGLQFQSGRGIGRRLGISFHGVNGTLTADYTNNEVISEGERIDPSDLPPAPERTWPEHDREFLNSIKTRELTSCDFGYHYNVHAALNLGQLAYDMDRKLRWDSENKAIIGDPEADAALYPKYRAPWVLPV